MTTTFLSDLTTLNVGGPAGAYIRATTEEQIIDAVGQADAAHDAVLVLGGGSNLVIGDDGFSGTVVHVDNRGVEVVVEGDRARVTAAAGEPWDALVAHTVDHGYSGLEALSGIPGITGATPVQNVGAYGTEVSQYFASARLYDRVEGGVVEFGPSEMGFAYRDSRLKREMLGRSPRWVVLAVTFELAVSTDSAPVRYAELARRLGVEVGEAAPAALVRDTVLSLRAGKGMVLDPRDRDTYSTGSFFTNPIVAVEDAASVPDDAPRYPVLDPTGAVDDTKLKLSAAWLIEHAGFGKGFGLDGEAEALAGGRASLSTKHTLAITNRGGAKAKDIAAIAREVRDGVERRFGVRLEPEPVVVGADI